MATNILGLMDYMQRQGDIGRARGEESKLASLFSQAMRTPSNQRAPLLAEMASVRPEAAIDYQAALNKLDDRAWQDVGRYAQAFAALPDEQQKAAAYPQLVERARALGIPVPQEAYRPEYGENIRRLAEAFGDGGQQNVPAGYQEFDMLARDANLSPEDRATAARRALYLERRPSNAAMQYRTITGSDDRDRLFALDPNNPDATQIGGGAASGNALYSGVQGVIAPLGGRITSTNGGQHNPGSRHYNGGAIDVGMAQETPEQQEQMIRALEAAGYTVRDERQRPPGQAVWSGPHLHVEGGGQVNPYVSRTPEERAYAEGVAKEQAEIQSLPERGRIEANNARLKKEAELKAQSEADKRAQAPKARRTLESARTATGHVTRAIEQALPHVSVWTAGTLGTPLSRLGGSAAANLRASLATIESNIAFDRLQQMRDNSVTGGALGQVSERELDLLASTITSIKQSQSPEQLRQNLQYLAEQYPAALQRMEAAFREDYGNQADGTIRAGSIEDGYRFMGGDPADPSNWEAL